MQALEDGWGLAAGLRWAVSAFSLQPENCPLPGGDRVTFATLCIHSFTYFYFNAFVEVEWTPNDPGLGHRDLVLWTAKRPHRSRPSRRPVGAAGTLSRGPPWPREIARGEALAPASMRLWLLLASSLFLVLRSPDIFLRGVRWTGFQGRAFPGPLCGSRSAFPVLRAWQPPGIICPSRCPLLGTLARCAGLLEPACVIVAATPVTWAPLQAGAGEMGAQSAGGGGCAWAAEPQVSAPPACREAPGTPAESS